MKKLVTIVCAMLMMAAFAIPTFAATTKDDIIAELKAGVQVGDKTKAIPEKYIDVAEKFFAANELTDEQLATALTEVKEAKELWASTGETGIQKHSGRCAETAAEQSCRRRQKGGRHADLRRQDHFGCGRAGQNLQRPGKIESHQTDRRRLYHVDCGFGGCSRRAGFRCCHFP